MILSTQAVSPLANVCVENHTLNQVWSLEFSDMCGQWKNKKWLEKSWTFGRIVSKLREELKKLGAPKNYRTGAFRHGKPWPTLGCYGSVQTNWIPQQKNSICQCKRFQFSLFCIRCSVLLMYAVRRPLCEISEEKCDWRETERRIDNSQRKWSRACWEERADIQ